jgi:23S rRNA (adenine-C8)-methyltransferase
MGEPFANMEELTKALDILTSPEFIGMSPRKLGLSTVGLTGGIDILGKDYPQVNLALSLHSPFEGERQKLMPISKAYPIVKVMAAVKKYIEVTNNKVFISYLLLGGINDSDRHAKALVDLIRSQGSKSYLYHVNLIRYNPGPALVVYKRATADRVHGFQEILTKYKVPNTLRQDFGVEIEAGCGQLYAKYAKARPTKTMQGATGAIK